MDIKDYYETPWTACDKHFDVWVEGQGHLLVGFESKYYGDNSDRYFKFFFYKQRKLVQIARPVYSSGFDENKYDQTFDVDIVSIWKEEHKYFKTLAGIFIYGIQSKHNNGKEDRIFEFRLARYEWYCWA